MSSTKRSTFVGQIRKELGKRHRGSSSVDKHRSEKRARPSGSRSREPRKDGVGRHSSASKREEAEAPAVIDKPSLPEGGKIAEETIGGSSERAAEVSPLQIVIVSDVAEEMSPVHPMILLPDVLQFPAVGSPLRMEEAPAQVEGSGEAVAAAEAPVEPPVERLVEVEVPPVEGLSVMVPGDAMKEIEVQVEFAGDEVIVGEEEEEVEESLDEGGARAEAPSAGTKASEALQAKVLMKEAERMAVP